MNLNLSPIVVFCYNRPRHVAQTLEALSKNELASKSVLYIYCDGPKMDASAEQKRKIEETRAIVKSKEWCGEVHIVEFDVNQGLASNIITGVTEIVERYGRVIVLEDDMVTSPGFLRYMNDALEMYKDDTRVMHITGYMFPIKHANRLPETFFYEVPMCWSWATWARAWCYFSDDIEALYSYWKKDWKRFNHWGGHDLQDQLEANYHGRLRTWFVKWHAVVLRNDGLTLWPRKSLVHNIGFDGSGENCGTWNKQETPECATNIDVVRISKIKESKKASREIKIFNSGHWYSKRYRKAWIEKLKSFFRI